MTREQIETWLTQQGIVNFEITKDLIVNVNGNVDLHDRGLTSIPVRFGVVTGDFLCYNNKLTSLEHAPVYVGGDLWCSANNLISLLHAPRFVGKDFLCNGNKLTSLKHAPVYVGGSFYSFDEFDLPKETILHRDRYLH